MMSTMVDKVTIMSLPLLKEEETILRALVKWSEDHHLRTFWLRLDDSLTVGDSDIRMSRLLDDEHLPKNPRLHLEALDRLGFIMFEHNFKAYVKMPSYVASVTILLPAFMKVRHLGKIGILRYVELNVAKFNSSLGFWGFVVSLIVGAFTVLRYLGIIN